MGSSDVGVERGGAKSFTMEKDGRGRWRTSVGSIPIPKEPIPWVESIHLLVWFLFILDKSNHDSRFPIQNLRNDQTLGGTGTNSPFCSIADSAAGWYESANFCWMPHTTTEPEQLLCKEYLQLNLIHFWIAPVDRSVVMRFSYELEIWQDFHKF